MLRCNKWLNLQFESKSSKSSEMYRLKKIIIRYFIFAPFLFLSCLSCDDEIQSVIPNVPVSFTVNLSIVNELTIPGNSAYFNGPGFGGVIVYCELPGSYFAFDATCTHEVSTGCRVKNDGVVGTCPCCGSQFIFPGGGYASKGPAAQALKPYRTSLMTNGLLRVYN